MFTLDNKCVICYFVVNKARYANAYGMLTLKYVPVIAFTADGFVN